MADPLPTLLRLRRLAVDQARRALADCLRSETEAREAVRETEAAIAREQEAASQPTGDDQTVEDFAVWLRRARSDLAHAAEALLVAETRTQEARIALVSERSAMETVETMIARHDTEKAAQAMRQEQAALDETVRPRPLAEF